MVWEAEPRAEVARRLAELGIHSAVFSPCANVPPRGDWLACMRAGAAALAASRDFLE